MKLNWGNALVIFFVFYVGLLGFILYKSTTVDSTLVMENYYEHDIAYQARYDQITNRKLLKDDLKIKLDATQKEVVLDFGSSSEAQSGKLKFYSPVNKRRDKEIDFQMESSQMKSFDIKDFIPGRYKVQVEWKDNKRSYFKEESIFIGA